MRPSSETGSFDLDIVHGGSVEILKNPDIMERHSDGADLHPAVSLNN